MMFNSLIQAINYVPQCPLCKGSLGFDNKGPLNGWSRNVSSYDYSTKTILNFVEASQGYTDKLNICIETENVEREITFTNVQNGTSPAGNGLKYLGLGITCLICQNYSFMIQIVVELEKPRIAALYLNSETVTFEDRNIHNPDEVIELRNVYTTSRTEYHFYTSKSPNIHINRREDLPLVPLDRNCPDKTLQRVQKLLLWT